MGRNNLAAKLMNRRMRVNPVGLSGSTQMLPPKGKFDVITPVRTKYIKSNQKIAGLGQSQGRSKIAIFTGGQNINAYPSNSNLRCKLV